MRPLTPEQMAQANETADWLIENFFPKRWSPKTRAKMSASHKKYRQTPEGRAQTARLVAANKARAQAAKQAHSLPRRSRRWHKLSPEAQQRIVTKIRYLLREGARPNKPWRVKWSVEYRLRELAILYPEAADIASEPIKEKPRTQAQRRQNARRQQERQRREMQEMADAMVG